MTDGAAGDLIVANHPNGLGAAVLAVENELGVDPAGTLADLATRLAVSQNTNGTLLSSVVVGGTGVTVSYSSGVFTLSSTPEGAGNLQNLGVEVVANAPSANAMRFRLVQADGSTPTATAFPRISFHAATSTSPTFLSVTATTDTALTLSSGSTLGFNASQASRLYFWAINANAGQSNSVIELGVSRSAIFSEAVLQTTTAEGGAGAADSDSVLYSATVRTGIPVRCLGYIDINTGTTAGQWSNNPFAGSLMGYGVKRTGEIVQRVATYTNAMKQTTTTFPIGTSTPPPSAGVVVLWATISATSLVNQIQVSGNVNLTNDNTSSGALVAGLFQTATSSTARWVTHQQWDGTGGTRGGNQAIFHEEIASQTAATGWYVNVGCDTAGTTSFNGLGAAQVGGQAGRSYLVLTEVAV